MTVLVFVVSDNIWLKKYKLIDGNEIVDSVVMSYKMRCLRIA